MSIGYYTKEEVIAKGYDPSTLTTKEIKGCEFYILIKDQMLEAESMMVTIRQRMQEIQNRCAHPFKVTKDRYDSDYDGIRYWKEFTCPDCNKFWTTL